jgi:ComF family protein
MRSILQRLENAVMPMRCAFCGEPTRGSEGHVCCGCACDLPWVEPPPSQAPFVRLIAPLAYEFPVDAAIKALKFRRRLFYGPALAQLLNAACAELPGDLDAVLPVPLHWRRHWLRGFNQALEIGRPVAKRLDVPVIHSVKRRRATPPQSGLTAAERAGNLQAAFVACKPMQHRHVLIVDDVITTGATVRQLASTLREAGVERISMAAVARA